jgi:lipopolysaccharide export LptBFGC system permease protein LptF
MPESKLPIDNSESMTYTVPYESAKGIVENKEGEIVDKFSYYMGLNRNNTEHKKIIDAMPTYPEFDKYGNVTGQKSKLSRKDYMSTNGKSRTEAKDLDLYTQMGTL